MGGVDDGLRKGLELAGLIVTAGLSLLLGAWRLAEGISGHAWWMIALGGVMLLAGALCVLQARQLHRESAG